MIPQKRFFAGLMSIALSMSASVASAQTFLGSTVSEAKALLPPDAVPETSSAEPDTLTYHDVRMGDVVWKDVVLRFDGAHRLASLSLHTRDLGYDALKARALAQMQLYAADQMRQQSTLGAVAVPAGAAMQIRLCQTDDEVEMTYEREAQQL